MPDASRYARIIERIFREHFKRGMKEVPFKREEIVRIAKQLRIEIPKNLGDLIYSFRYRTPLPASVRAKAPKGKQWIIRPRGRAQYCFEAVTTANVVPNKMMSATKVPDATPGVIAMYAQSDEQALLARLRYNRLIDVFAGVACYSLQNHLRTSVRGLGQIETDEVYVGIDRRGAHHVFPVQAKGGKDKMSIVQIEQDIAMCAAKFPALICCPIAAQFMTDGAIALFAFEATDEGVKVSAEKHYRLVPPGKMTAADLRAYREALQ